MFTRKIAVLMFYDTNLNILVQKRNSHSKIGESYAFFGGGIEDGETPEVAVRRELIEELNYTPKQLTYWGKYSFIYATNEYGGDLFLAPIIKELLNCKSEDDTIKVLLPIDDVLQNKNEMFGAVKFNNTEEIKNDIIDLAKKLN